MPVTDDTTPGGTIAQLPNGMIEHSDGVWCNLHFDDYLLETALGSSDLNQLRRSPIEWWWMSRWNPLRPPEPAKLALLRGVAAHVAFLDGMKVYDRLYGIMPDKVSHPNALDTVTELKAAARGAGVSFPNDALKSDLIYRMVQSGQRFEILDVLKDKFRRTGKLPISREDDAVIRILHKLAMRTHDELGLPKSHPIPRQALSGGVHEVTVIWTDADGIRQRARFDQLKANVSLDLKTISDWRHGNFEKDLLLEAVRRGYFGQWAHYDEGRRQLRKAVDEGRVYGANATQMKRLLEVAAAEEWAWSWLFVKTDGAPRVKAVIPDREQGHYMRARQDREEALAQFAFFRERYGMESTWLDTTVVWVPDHTDYPDFYTLD